MTARYQSEILQDAREIDALAELFEHEQVGSYLEVGAKFGGSLWKIGHSLPKGSRIVAIDLPDGTKAWRESSESLKDCVAALNELGHDARIIWGDSTSSKVLAEVIKLAPFDAIFIDANHTAPFVKQDWENYGPLSRIVAFHDIAWRRAPEWVGTRIDVPQFWASIKNSYRHQEFRFCPTGKNNGIGVLWRS